MLTDQRSSSEQPERRANNRNQQVVDKKEPLAASKQEEVLGLRTGGTKTQRASPGHRRGWQRDAHLIEGREEHPSRRHGADVNGTDLKVWPLRPLASWAITCATSPTSQVQTLRTREGMELSQAHTGRGHGEAGPIRGLCRPTYPFPRIRARVGVVSGTMARNLEWGVRGLGHLDTLADGVF